MLFKSSSSSLCIGKEQPFRATAHWGMLPGFDTITGKPLLTWGQEVPWNSAMDLEPLSSLWHSLCSEAMFKKHIHLMAEGNGTERSMPTNKASCIINFCDRLWPSVTLSSWFVWDYKNIWDCRSQETNWGIVLPAPLSWVGKDFILQESAESAQFGSLSSVAFSHKGLAGEQWVKCDVLGSSVKASAVQTSHRT